MAIFFDAQAELERLLNESAGQQQDFGDPWAEFENSGNVAPLEGVQLGAPPMLNTDPTRSLDFIDMISGRIGDAFNFDTPMADTALLGDAPQAALSQFATSPELQSMLSGEGFDPATLALMRTQAREAPAMAGRQQLGQMRRALSQAGIEGPAAAGYMGDVARNTGYQQSQNLQNVELNNALQGIKNKQFGIGMQTNIGLTNMQQANMLALQNANMMFEALRANQNAQNSMNQFNTGNKVNQQMNKANTQGSYAASAGLNAQQNAQQNEAENANKQWGQEIWNKGNDWQTQLLPWQEQNQRFGQSVGTLGSLAQ